MRLNFGILRILAVLAFGLALASCSIADGGRGNVRPYSDAEFGPPDAPERAPVAADYRIGALDTLTVTVFQVPDLSGDRQVDNLGKIDLPLVGSVDVFGLTVAEISKKLEALYGAKYLQAPQVQVQVKDAVAQRVTVDGSVKQPGIYPIKGSTTLLQAIALAKGLDDYANPSRVAVFRTVNGKRLAAGFDLQEIRHGKMKDPDLYGNDIVMVDGSRTRKAYRDIIQSIPLLAVFGAF